MPIDVTLSEPRMLRLERQLSRVMEMSHESSALRQRPRSRVRIWGKDSVQR